MIRIVSLSLAFVLGGAGCAGAEDTTRGRSIGLKPVLRVAERQGGKMAKPRFAAAVHPRPITLPASKGRSPGLVDLPRFPSISPDGSQIVFSWRGDLWKASASGGHSERLTTHPGDDLRSAWSPDGRSIAFDSDRTGYRNIFIMNADGTDVRPVTRSDQSCTLSAFGVDYEGNEVVTFSGRLEGDNYRAPRPYMCSTQGGEIVRLHDAFGGHPKVSADGKSVAFTRGGVRWIRRGYQGADSRDVWHLDRTDGSFTQLTHWPGNDGKACWAGRDALVFISDRELDCCNLYRMDIAGARPKASRLTSFTENDVQDVDVSADGSTAVFMVWDKLYTLALGDPGAEPVPLTITANEDEHDNFLVKSIDKEVSEAALSPDGKSMAFVAYGEVYVRNIEEKSPTRRVAGNWSVVEPRDRHPSPHARERQIAWSPDGLKLFFVSDRTGSDSIYAATVAMTRGEVKKDFEKATEPPAEETQEEVEPGGKVEEESEEDEEGEEDETEAATDDVSVEAEAQDDETDEKGNDTKKEKKKKKEKEELPKELQPKRWRDAMTFLIEPVVLTDHNDRTPRPSPDGKSLAFRRGRGDLMILDFESGETRKFVEGWDTDLDWRWSPDSRHIAYQQHDLNFNSDIWIAVADGSKPTVNITRHPDDDFNPRWSADGKILSFVSERIHDEFDLWMVYLDSDLEVATPAELEKYYKDAVKAAKKRKPLKIEKPENEEDEEAEEAEGDKQDDEDTEDEDEDEGEEGDEEDEEDEDEDEEDEAEEKEPKELDLEDAYLRLRRVTKLSGDEGNNEITPGGDRYVFTATIGKKGLYSVKWNGEDRKRLADSASVQHVSLTGDKIVLVKDGHAGTIGPEGDKIEFVDISDRVRIDLEEQASQKFTEMARLLGENFYHPTLKGLDWDALSKKYHALARQTRTAGEFNHVGMRLFGELSGSHLGVYSRGPSSPNAQPQGRLGTVHNRIEQATIDGTHGYEVIEVVPESPASLGPMALKPKDVIVAVNLERFTPMETLESRLLGLVDKEVIVTIKRTMDDAEVKELKVLITPIGAGELNRLKYSAWRRANADLVAQWSGSRIGYIHIRGMSQPSLDVFERDLYAAAEGKDGLLIDVRNNGGGWTADRVLASIMVQPHAYTIPRGADPNKVGHYPQPRLFIQRYTLPVNMLCNEKSFSNAEIVSHAFKTLRRGTLVGQITHGSVISTGGTTLIDGTWVRLPFRGWFVPDGTDMENHGAVPDIIVPQTPEAESRNEDEQLRAATEDLLKRL